MMLPVRGDKYQAYGRPVRPAPVADLPFAR